MRPSRPEFRNNPASLLPCVYAIKSTIDKRMYIGSSKNVRSRTSTHFHNLKHGKHSSKHLQKFYDKYGAEKLTVEILENCPIEKLIEREQYWMDYISNRRSRSLLFNACPNAGTPKGLKHTKQSLYLREKKAAAKRKAKFELENREYFAHSDMIAAALLERSQGKCEDCLAQTEPDLYFMVVDIEETRYWRETTVDNQIFLCGHCIQARRSARKKFKMEQKKALKTATV